MSPDIVQIATARTRKSNKKKTIEDAKRWAEMYKARMSLVKIAKQEGVDPGTVSKWLSVVGVDIKQGSHFVEQPPLSFDGDQLELFHRGPEHITNFLESSVWGIRFTEEGLSQMKKFLEFISMHQRGKGVEEIASALGVHRSSILDWRNGNGLPYLIKVALVAHGTPPAEGWKLLPLRVGAGGNDFSGWISVPVSISGYSDLVKVVQALEPNQEALDRAGRFGISNEDVRLKRIEFYAYLLGMVLGDAGKLGGEQERFCSMNLDLQLTTKHDSNEALGEFVCFCVNALGFDMDRVQNKQPSGISLLGKDPAEAYRWSSERSPIFAWMFNVCLGLDWGNTTSLTKVNMDWISSTPFEFRKRFIQGLADSDGRVSRYLVEIVSTPNADFVTELLHSLGLTSAYTRLEYGKPLRTAVRAIEAATLPIFNEYTKGYRFSKLMWYWRAGR
jgi:transcriptional regulator with XRE-family HTH domain